MRKNKWWNKQTGEIFSYNLELPNETGTRLTAEFVSFFKDEGRDDSAVYFNTTNIGPYISLHETCLSNGKVWTFLTNKDGKGGRGTLGPAVPRTKRDEMAKNLRKIFNTQMTPTKAMKKMNEWYEKVRQLGNANFRSVIKAFNSRVKIFRAQMKGVRDRNFFIFRLVKLYA